MEQNAHRAAEQTATVPEYPRNIRERLQGKKAVQTTPEKDGIQRMVDRAAKRAEGKGAGYDCWAAVHNLKQMAATVAAYGQYGYSPEELDAALVSANADLQDSTAKLKALDAAIREKKELQTQVLAYAKTKPARDGLKAQKTEKARSAYRERHESDFIIADAATRYFRAHGVSKLAPFPQRSFLSSDAMRSAEMLFKSSRCSSIAFEVFSSISNPRHEENLSPLNILKASSSKRFSDSPTHFIMPFERSL